ncbi:hypothetical protein VSR01_10750 [Actinacidiphila sp. DG2A-62]|uniref:hypothetical protein n=1 Tax=Actinacidiphila sp. DG2A-62 TaxID=3108821 RepID=UPI002DBCC929|nr:hypothetical protein [Actinacidiphila sp. DG2A-62]MEC3993997.1 hypothetical protein [Actinacidiphila sp. DG2A-62]
MTVADEVQVIATGPLFDGRAARAARAYCDDVRDEIAARGEDLVLAKLGMVLRHPTGYYESQISTEPAGADTSVVGDGGVVYGPWLEGTGSRNTPITRFAGYGHWRAAKEKLAGEAPEIADRLLRVRYLPEMR